MFKIFYKIIEFIVWFLIVLFFIIKYKEYFFFFYIKFKIIIVSNDIFIFEFIYVNNRVSFGYVFNLKIKLLFWILLIEVIIKFIIFLLIE